MEFIILIAITSLKVIFLYGAMQEDEILFRFRQLLERFVSVLPCNIQGFIAKPLFECMFCMSGFWGLVFLFLPLPWYIDTVLCVAGLNYVLQNMFHREDYTREQFRSQLSNLHKRIKELEDDKQEQDL